MSSNDTTIERTRRSTNPGRREEDFCARHEENTMAIGRHSGQWKVLLWILALGIGTISSIAGTAYYAQQKSMDAIVTGVHSIDKMVTAYIAGHTIETKEGIRRIILLEEQVISLDRRMDRIEKSPTMITEKYLE